MDTRVWGAALGLLVVGALGLTLVVGGAGEESAPEIPGPRIGDPAPPLQGGARALMALAQHYDVGLVLCPVPAQGTVARVFGTPRDMQRGLGPTYLADYDARAEAPWDPLYDVGFVEEGWVAILAAPGSTSGMIRPYQTTIAMTWPAAKAREVVTCDSAVTLPRRTVSGKASGEAPLRYSSLVGCGKPQRLQPDGSFTAEVDAPCTLWAEARGFKSNLVRVEADEDATALEGVALPMVADPHFTEDGLTPAGFAAVTSALRRESEVIRLHLTALEGLRAQLADDALVVRQLSRWQTAQEEWVMNVEALLYNLENPPEEPPQPARRHP